MLKKAKFSLAESIKACGHVINRSLIIVEVNSMKYGCTSIVK